MSLSENKIIKVPTEELQREFKTAMDDVGNQRIIFSGIFGIGKTTFIREFFEAHSSEYVAIKIFPVNYSVASNEDIFELIKYDILYDLLSKNPEFERVDVTWYEALHFMSPDDLRQIVGNFVALIPKIGRKLIQVEKALKKTMKVFNRKRSELGKDDLTDVIEFAKKLEDTPGGIYENDFYTQLIESLIHSLRVGQGGKRRQIVLVIDDLDRIDPEHIFRILNVFAAHFDHDETTNKFQFDKIVLCCDVENIRSIFHNRYGLAVDFNGYIDKFFSRKVFYFKNHANLKRALSTILSSISSLHSNFIFLNGEHYLHQFLIVVLEKLISNNRLNLRMLRKFMHVTYDSDPRHVPTSNRNFILTIRNFGMMLLFEFLIDMFGSITNLITALKEIQLDFTFKTPFERRIMGDLLYIAHWQKDLSEEMIYQQGYDRSYIIDGVAFSVHIFNERQTGGAVLYQAIYQSENNDFSMDSDTQRRILLAALNSYGVITGYSAAN